MSNNNCYRILTNGDEDKDNIGSLHTILDDSINISFNIVQARVEEAEVQQLEIEIAQELKVLNTDLKQANKRITKALSTIIDIEMINEK